MTITCTACETTIPENQQFWSLGYEDSIVLGRGDSLRPIEAVALLYLCSPCADRIRPGDALAPLLDDLETLRDPVPQDDKSGCDCMGCPATIGAGEILTSLSIYIEVLSGGVLHPHWAEALYQCCGACQERLELREVVREFLRELIWPAAPE